MASENLINELFEIVQANSKEKIYYNDFEKDLLTNINLPNDDIDKALAMIISHAEINPDIVGETKGGSFIISQSFTKSIVSTIEYEKVLIERKNLVAENAILDAAMGVMLMENADKLIDNVLITDDIAKQMINNYENLTAEEVGAIWDNYDNLDSETKEALREARKKDIQKVIDDPEATLEDKAQAEKDLKAATRFDDEEKAGSKGFIDPLRRKKYIEVIKDYREKNFEVFDRVYPGIDKIEDLSDEMIIMIKSAITHAEDKSISLRYRDRVFTIGLEQNEDQQLDQTIDRTIKDFVATQTDGRATKIVQSSQNPNELEIDSGKKLKQIVYCAREEDFAYIIAGLDSMYQTIELPDEEKLPVIELLGNIIKNLSEADIANGEASIKKKILFCLEMESGKKNYAKAVSKMLDIYDSLIPAIVDNRDGIVDRAINPYIEGIKEGKNIMQIMCESFKTVQNEQLTDIRSQYFKYTREVEKTGFIGKAVPQQSSVIDAESRIYNPQDNFVQYSEIYTQIPIGKMPIKDVEYNGVKKTEETLTVDEDGLKKALTSLERKGDVTQEIPNTNGFNYVSEFGEIPQQFMRQKLSAQRRPPRIIANQPPNEEKKSETAVQIDSEAVLESDESKEVTSDEKIEKIFFDPIKDGYKKVKEVRAMSLKAQTEVLKEAAKISEQSLQELIEQEKGETPVQE